MSHRAGIYDHTVPMQGQSAVANAQGIATTVFGPVPEGYAWYAERISVHSPTTNTKVSVNVMLGAVLASAPTLDSSQRADFTILANNDSVADENSPIFIPAGYSLVVQYTAATSADICVTSVQYAVHELEPRRFMSPEDLRQLEASHQKATSPVTRSATAANRAYDDAGDEEMHIIKDDPFSVPAG